MIVSQNVLTTLTFKDSFSVSSKCLASWDWRDTSLYTPVLCAPLPLSEISDRSTTEVLINSLFVPPPNPLSLSLVSQVSDSSKHCGFPHSHYTRGTRGEMCACVYVCTEEEESYTTAQYSPVSFIAESELTQSRGDIAAISPLAMRQVCTLQRGRSTAVNTV